MARLDHPDAGEANAQALDDLAGGADGLTVVFAGAIGAHGFGLRKFDPATLHAAFEGVRFDAGAHFELDLGTNGPREALASPRSSSDRAPARPTAPSPSDSIPSLPPRRAVSGRLVVAGEALSRRRPVAPRQELRRTLFRRRCEKRSCGGRRAGPGTSLRALGRRRSPARARARRRAARRGAGMIAFPPRGRRGRVCHFVEVPRFAPRLGAVEEACGLMPRKAHVQAESAWRMMTARDPYVNIMRGTIAAFSAGLGGADSVCVLPHTLAVGLPDGLARRLARNGQLVLLRESNLGFVADPAAGAGGFEALTRALVDKGWLLFQSIEGRGGLPAALADGAFQREIGESAAALKRDAARLKAPITGVSAHPHLDETPAEIRAGRRRSGNILPHWPARSRRCGSPSRSKPCATGRTPSAQDRRATESLSRRPRSRARPSPPRRLHPRMARSRRRRAGL